MDALALKLLGAHGHSVSTLNSNRTISSYDTTYLVTIPSKPLALILFSLGCTSFNPNVKLSLRTCSFGSSPARLQNKIMFRRANKSAKQSYGVQNSWVPVLFITSTLIFVGLIFLLSSKGKSPSLVFGSSMLKWNSFQHTVQLHPTLELRNGTDVIWQIPDSPKAILFLAHGCNGQAMHFWDRSPSCPNCVGLPEERLIVLHALARKFVVLTVSSAGRCWSFGKERERVKGIIRWWTEKNKLDKLNLVAMGASSGGYFVSALATNIRFSSITLMIAEGIFDAMDIPTNYPPTLFVHMPKDHSRAHLVSKNMEALRQKGIDVAEIRCMKFPLTPTFLSDRIPGLDEAVSINLFEMFRTKGFIDENGYMRKDGRQTQWKAALKELKNVLSDDNELSHHIQEELNVAFAYHEMTSFQTEQILNWFESHMS